MIQLIYTTSVINYFGEKMKKNIRIFTIEVFVFRKFILLHVIIIHKDTKTHKVRKIQL